MLQHKAKGRIDRNAALVGRIAQQHAVAAFTTPLCSMAVLMLTASMARALLPNDLDSRIRVRKGVSGSASVPLPLCHCKNCCSQRHLSCLYRSACLTGSFWRSDLKEWISPRTVVSFSTTSACHWSTATSTCHLLTPAMHLPCIRGGLACISGLYSAEQVALLRSAVRFSSGYFPRAQWRRCAP